MLNSSPIIYTYDPLGRLIYADYGGGVFFQYTYDAVGNRLTETTQSGTTTYTYDAANRIATVDGVAYTYDNNGNLLNDGSSTYTYDHANRLKSVTQDGVTYTYAYNGLGDRVSQTVGGVTTRYTLDLNSGLTQVLADGTNTYLYGNERIAQYSGTNPSYFLGDALGSVRQLVDSTGAVTLTMSFKPFGDVLSSQGAGTSVYGFDAELKDPTGLVYLRARYYAAGLGRFISKDTWNGDSKLPLSYNKWIYGNANPINFSDSSGYMVTAVGIDNGDFVYSCRAGFIDFGHAGSINAKQIFDLLDKENRELLNLRQGSRPDIFAIRPSTDVALVSDASLTAVVRVGATKSKLNQIALGIYRSWMEKIEYQQWFPGVSYFSFEDLTSDEIGFYLYLHFKEVYKGIIDPRQKDGFNQEAWDWLAEITGFPKNRKDAKEQSHSALKELTLFGKIFGRDFWGFYPGKKEWGAPLGCKIEGKCDSAPIWPSEFTKVKPISSSRDGDWWIYDGSRDGQLKESSRDSNFYFLEPYPWPAPPR
jgi:RHS repeat-associated protein